jgi:hypothetical protein
MERGRWQSEVQHHLKLKIPCAGWHIERARKNKNYDIQTCDREMQVMAGVAWRRATSSKSYCNLEVLQLRATSM